MKCSLPFRFVLFLACGLLPRLNAQVTLEALSRDGYGMAQIKRPTPNQLMVSGTVNGAKVGLILDTGFGGDGITLDSSYAGRLHIATEAVKEEGRSVSGKRLPTRRGASDVVTLGNVQMRGVPLYFGLFQALRDDRKMGADGFISEGFLHTCSAVVDLHNLRLYLRPPGKGRLAVLGPALTSIGLSEVPFAEYGHSCIVDVEINGVAGKMILDTGATLSGVDHRFADQMKTYGYSFGSITDAAGVKIDSDKAPLRSFKIAGVEARAPDLQVSTYSFYPASGNKVVGLLGMDILGQDWAIIDFGQRKLYFAGIKK